MILIITVIVFLAILIVTHEFGHFITAKLFKLRVDEFAFGFPPKIFSKKVGETTYSLNSIPFGGFVRIYGESGVENASSEKKEDVNRSFYIQQAWKRALIIASGVFMNFIIGWLAFSGIAFFSGIPQGGPIGLHIKDILPGSPAEIAGIKSGDRINDFMSISDFQSFVSGKTGDKIMVAGREVVPAADSNGEGKIGVILEEEYILAKYNFVKSIGEGFIVAITLIKDIYRAVGDLVVGLFSGEKVLSSLTGPVGIFNEIGRASSNGVEYLVQLLGILSLNLAVFNALPFPALDGGRLLFILIEKIIGKRLNVKYEVIANLVGFALLILLAITVTVNDIYRLAS